MTQGTVTYSGITLTKGAEYTHTRGIRPDRVVVDCVPQVSSIPDIGDIVFGYGATSLTLPDCLADKSLITLNESGFTGSISFDDRRWRWSRYSAVSYHWNERDVLGNIVTATQKHMRAMVLQLCTDIGESSADVSALPTDFYPEFDVLCDRPDIALDTLLQTYGYDICLHFGSESVEIVKIGVGTTLPTANLMAASTGVDPPTPPQYVQICFGPSEAQARFKLKAYGLDTDTTFKEFDDLSYIPSAGWETEPLNYPNVFAQHGESDWLLAIESVYRCYAIDTFTDDTLDIPDGSGTLSSIKDVLPLYETLLSTDTLNGRVHHPRPRIYGIYWKDKHPIRGNTDVGDLVELPFQFDRYRGMVIFNEPVFRVDTATRNTLPAELYLEAAFRIRSATTFQFRSYVKNVEVNASGYGYHHVKLDEFNAQTVTNYDSSQAVVDFDTNESTLDTIAAAAVSNAAGEYTYSSRDIGIYNKPVFTIRLDGLISQIKFVITDGDNAAGNHTIAARNMEFDMFIRNANERRMELEYLQRKRYMIGNSVISRRPEKGND